jgi:NAD(P)-dependent dehydrogenase (short-subunit alcohol dehydrogenase family)
MKNFFGKIVYITGGASGIGLETGKRLAAAGAHIAVLDYSPTEAAMDAITAARRRPMQRVGSYRVDMADRAGVLETVAQAAVGIGAPDLVINCAGIGVTGEFATMKFEDFDRVMQVNLYGSRHLCEAVLPLMRARGDGNIVLVASMAGITPVYGYTDYSTSKYAVLGFGECLRYELKPLGIEVQICCPGEVETPMVAAERAIIHPATHAMKQAGGHITVHQAVDELIAGIVRGKPLIVLGGKARLTFWLRRLVPPSLWYAACDSIVARALRAGSQA